MNISEIKAKGKNEKKLLLYLRKNKIDNLQPNIDNIKKFISLPQSK